MHHPENNETVETKTEVSAEPNRQEIIITRVFDVTAAQLFRGFTEAGLVAQWMGTMVERLDDQAPGAYRFVTTDPRGMEHVFQGTLHKIDNGTCIVRTFEMVGTPFPPQLEFLDFESLSPTQSRLRMQIIFQSVHWRDELLKMPFAQGIQHAHNRLQRIFDTH